MTATDVFNPPVIWRTKLRSTIGGVDHSQQVQHCLDRGLIGIGWRMDHVVEGTSLADVTQRIEDDPRDGWGPTAAQTVRRFGQDAKPGDFVWTRDTSGRYLLCRITGPYRYDTSEEAKLVDVHQVRDVEWAPRALNDLDVPGGVIRSFIGIGLSFSRIHDVGARVLTAYLWEKLHDRPLPRLVMTRAEVLASHLDPYDVEDLVYVWLQVARGYIALPRARQRDTPAYEWTMLHRVNKRRAIVQIKTGSTPVDLDALARAVADDATDTYAFATSGKYEGQAASVTEVIDPGELLSFSDTNADALPTRIRGWFDLADAA